ncbi:MAG: putative sodium/hydrogen antiporter [Chloroflexi bacterium]|nr:putative sodium/hydrogen antiporter [Chloroflexota bacterium]
MSEATTPFLQLALSLAIIIAAAKIGGYLSLRLGQPSVLGELLVGILLGPTLLDLLNRPYFTDTHLPEVIHELAEIGVLLLMFLAGLELHLEDLARSGKISALAGTLGVVFPLALGAGLGLIFGENLTSSLFLGLILAATSVSISAQTLMELNRLRTRVGVSLLGAAVFDDVLVVLSLSIFTAVAVSGSDVGWLSVIMIAVRMLFFLAVSALLGFWLLPRWSYKVDDLPVSQGLIAFTLVMVFLYGWSAEVLGGMAAITGAFLAGLVLTRSPVKDRIQYGVSIVAFGVFVPIFFVDIGLTADLKSLVGGGMFLLAAMLLVAVIGKLLGAGIGAILGGMNRKEALQLGIGMISRGEVGLIVAAVGLNQRLIDQDVFAAVVGVVILTTLITPPMLRAAFRPGAGERSKGKSLDEPGGETDSAVHDEPEITASQEQDTGLEGGES